MTCLSMIAHRGERLTRSRRRVTQRHSMFAAQHPHEEDGTRIIRLGHFSNESTADFDPVDISVNGKKLIPQTGAIYCT